MTWRAVFADPYLQDFEAKFASEFERWEKEKADLVLEAKRAKMGAVVGGERANTSASTEVGPGTYCPPQHSTHAEPSFLELHVIL